jgi:alkylhydroperoxidase/carboxymuconolactone decarboxylase family protein YurZ
MSGNSMAGVEILERIQQRRGHVWPLHRLMADVDPGFLDLFDQAYCYTLGFEPEPSAESLDVKHRELICACACAMSPVPIEVTIHHLERAFAAGLTERQAVEGFQALLIPAGGIALSNGMRALLAMREAAADRSAK